MAQNQKPHSRDKRVDSGSANVGKGRKVDTGSRPVGSAGGNRRENGTSQRASSSSSVSSSILGSLLSGKLDLKKILIIIAVVVVLFFVLKACGFNVFDMLGGGGNVSGGDGPGSSENYEDYNDAAVNRTVSSLARDKYTTVKGGGQDTVTVMVYMCGTDLESKYGMATSDLQEMLKATISDKVNVIVETGGCTKWKNNSISNSKNQIYKVESGKLKTLKSDAGTASMTDPSNLKDFIKYCKTNYPANRNILIFWDHGGGSVSGYGYDEKNPKSSSMTLAKIKSALDGADCKFDFIGFDACLMATLETALVCEEHADYLLASEETEPGTGWYYTRWLTELSENTSKPTIDVAKTLIDDFVTSSSSASSSAKVTLSIVDLAELAGTVPTAFTGFASSTNDMLKSDGFEKVSNARSGVRQFAASSKINQVDLVDLAIRIGSAESKELANALRDCVKYNRTTISRCYGISIYFPYENTKSVNSAVSSYNELGLDSEYAKCIKSFASLELGGQITAAASQVTGGSSSSGDLLGGLLSSFVGGGSSTSPLQALAGSFLGTSSSGSSSSSAAGFSIDPSTIIGLLGSFSGRSMPAELAWVDTELIADNAEEIAAKYLDASRLVATEKNGKKVLSLTDAEWSLIDTVELNVFVKDGDGYIDLGLDNTFEYDGDDLLLDYDGTWLTLNGNVCAYYLISDTEQDDGSYVTIGKIPALLNGEFVDLQVVFDKNNKYGTVTGAFPMYEDETDVQAKGLVQIKKGDEIELLCDYYALNGDYSASYTLGTKFTVGMTGLRLANMSIDAKDFSIMYRLTDIYGNHFWVSAD